MAGPRWVKLDVDYFGNPKIVGLSTPAKLLHVAAICWCGQHLTDGRVPAAAMRQLVSTTSTKRRHIDELLIARLLYEIDGDFELHDFTTMNGSRADVEARIEAKREAARKRQQRWREARRDDSS